MSTINDESSDTGIGTLIADAMDGAAGPLSLRTDIVDAAAANARVRRVTPGRLAGAGVGACAIAAGVVVATLPGGSTPAHTTVSSPSLVVAASTAPSAPASDDLTVGGVTFGPLPAGFQVCGADTPLGAGSDPSMTTNDGVTTHSIAIGKGGCTVGVPTAYLIVQTRTPAIIPAAVPAPPGGDNPIVASRKVNESTVAVGVGNAGMTKSDLDAIVNAATAG